MPLTLVVLPGVDGTEIFFRPFVEHTPPGVEVIVLDYVEAQGNSYEELLPLVRGQLPRERDFVLLGWSFSGPLAVMLGAQDIPGLRGLVLVGSFVRRPVPWLPPWSRALARPFLFRFYPFASMAKALFAGYSTPEIRALQAEAFKRADPACMAARVQALLAVDARAELERCRLPLLYLRSRADLVVHRSCGDEVVALATDARLVELDAPHLSLSTHPAQAWAQVGPFLMQLAAADDDS